MLASLFFKNNHEIYGAFYRNEKLIYLKGSYIPHNVSYCDQDIRIKNLLNPEITDIIYNDYPKDFNPSEKLKKMRIINVIKDITHHLNHNVTIKKYVLNKIIKTYHHDSDITITNDYDKAKMLANYHFKIGKHDVA